MCVCVCVYVCNSVSLGRGRCVCMKVGVGLNALRSYVFAQMEVPTRYLNNTHPARCKFTYFTILAQKVILFAPLLVEQIVVLQVYVCVCMCMYVCVSVCVCWCCIHAPAVCLCPHRRTPCWHCQILLGSTPFVDCLWTCSYLCVKIEKEEFAQSSSFKV